MSLSPRFLLAGLALVAAVPTSAIAATTTPTRIGVDQEQQVSFTLTDRSLTVKLRPVDGGPNPLSSEVVGQQVHLICRGHGPKDHKLRTPYTMTTWPTDATSVTVKLPRDASEKPKWCLMERDGGADLAVTYKMRIPRPTA